MASIKTTYASSGAITNAIESLGSSSTWVAGYESAPLDNTSNLYLDYLISGRITTGTSPSAGTIEVWAIGILDDTTYPDVFDGTTGAETVTSRDILYGFGKLVASLSTDTTSNRAYDFGPISLASLFGGQVPKKVVFFTTHNTGVNLNATGANQLLLQTGIYATST
jgi:hypothetical protein